MVTASDKYQSPDYENHCYFSQNFKKKKRKKEKKSGQKQKGLFLQISLVCVA